MQELSRKEREKKARDDEILNAAEKIFGSVGVEDASMDEIAREAQFTRKTLYQHFGSKEDLLCAVLLRGFGQLLAAVWGSVDATACGYERLRSMGGAFYGFYREHTDFFSLINYSGRMKALGSEEQKKEFADVDAVLFQVVARSIEDGKTDGSIRRDIDTAMGTASLLFSVTGFFTEYSATGKSFTAHLSLDAEKFVQYSLDLLLEAFHA